MELVGPDFRPLSFTVPEMTDENGERLTEPRNPQMLFHMRLPAQAPAYSVLRRAAELSGR